MTRKIITIRRAPQFSLDAEKRDRAVLQAVADRLGADVPMIDEQDLRQEAAADVFLSMGRLPETCSLLRRREEEGAVVVNKGSAVEACTRRHIYEIMRENHIPMPPLQGQRGYWLKRGDGLAQKAGDVIFCQTDDELEQAKALFIKKGIRDYVVSAHVEGSLVKFYCVGDRFFRWYYQDKEGDAYAFDAAALHATACRLARIIDIDVYGGDCIVCPDGSFRLIDFNDWPSFNPCRDEAADAIVELIREKYGIV